MSPQDLLAGPVVGVPYANHRVVPSAYQFFTSHLERHNSDSLQLMCNHVSQQVRLVDVVFIRRIVRQEDEDGVQSLTTKLKLSECCAVYLNDDSIRNKLDS